jgi:threonine dehydrogenase-like Zn-dependent dehydrogenase
MKAIGVVPGSKDSVRLIETDNPRVEMDCLLVRVLRAGIDGTDLEINQGLYGKAPDGKKILILGHESIGGIEETGEEIEGFKRGDLVVATVRRPCEEDCLNCRNGESDMCLTGHFKERVELCDICGIDPAYSPSHGSVEDLPGMRVIPHQPKPKRRLGGRTSP